MFAYGTLYLSFWAGILTKLVCTPLQFFVFDYTVPGSAYDNAFWRIIYIVYLYLCALIFLAQNYLVTSLGLFAFVELIRLVMEASVFVIFHRKSGSSLGPAVAFTSIVLRSLQFVVSPIVIVRCFLSGDPIFCVNQLTGLIWGLTAMKFYEAFTKFYIFNIGDTPTFVPFAGTTIEPISKKDDIANSINIVLLQLIAAPLAFYGSNPFTEFVAILYLIYLMVYIVYIYMHKNDVFEL